MKKLSNEERKFFEPSLNDWRREIFDSGAITLAFGERFMVTGAEYPPGLDEKLYEKYPDRNQWYNGLYQDEEHGKQGLYFAYLFENGSILELVEVFELKYLKNRKDKPSIIGRYDLIFTEYPYFTIRAQERIHFNFLQTTTDLPKIVNRYIQREDFTFIRSIAKISDEEIEDYKTFKMYEWIVGRHDTPAYIVIIQEWMTGEGPEVIVYDKRTQKEIFQYLASKKSWEKLAERIKTNTLEEEINAQNDSTMKIIEDYLKKAKDKKDD
ncbi:hypothetical protein [Lactococcus allomyrinae]|uniref:Uncharacterized protein n=1 Tax=Lactococcus allomyrinae TaxID=2419773 RepID=A0A387BE55_9LACT|nr:hypothetical protein [Lactococcus allomyrinae]AYF99878.1 hypothetical protein D7I46_01525 [Lactococcus allomyrinae]